MPIQKTLQKYKKCTWRFEYLRMIWNLILTVLHSLNIKCCSKVSDNSKKLFIIFLGDLGDSFKKNYVKKNCLYKDNYIVRCTTLTNMDKLKTLSIFAQVRKPALFVCT